MGQSIQESKICGRQSLKGYGLLKQFFKRLSSTDFTWSILCSIKQIDFIIQEFFNDKLYHFLES